MQTSYFIFTSVKCKKHLDVGFSFHFQPLYVLLPDL